MALWMPGVGRCIPCVWHGGRVLAVDAALVSEENRVRLLAAWLRED